jgi:hypothetical protein
MSKHHMQSTVLHDAHVMSVEQLMEEYGIEIDPDDGSVWDPFEYKSFDTVHEWAAYTQQMDEEEADEYQASSSKHTKTSRYSDDY